MAKLPTTFTEKRMQQPPTPQLHTPAHMSEGSMSRRRPSSPAPPAPATAPPLEDEDLLREILLRLRPQPSSLPRASLVCRRWRRLVSDPAFLRRFRAHHRNPPLLGLFSRGLEFTPTQDPPDRVPCARFFPPLPRHGRLELLGCRHGLALLLNRRRLKAVVWDPLTGHQRSVAFPPGFGNHKWVRNAAVLCAAGDAGHVHGDCHSSPFRLVFVRADEGYTHASACLYESESGVWGNIISIAVTDGTDPFSVRPSNSILVGNALHWLLNSGNILEFDFERRSLDVIEKPADAPAFISHSCLQILKTKENGLGFAILTGMSLELWERKANRDGVVRWVVQKTVKLDKLLPMGQSMGRAWVLIRGFDEDTNAIFLYTFKGLFMVQLESMQFRYIYAGDVGDTYYPYANFYTAGKEIGDGNGVEMLNNA